MRSSNPALPDGEALRRAEVTARAQGSGVGAGDLPGLWRFDQVWPRKGGESSGAAAGLLRALQASLEIVPAAAEQAMALRNRVRLGALELCFEGEAELVGRRPLLRFWFHRWQLRLGDRNLLERPLAKPPERSLPFFALIARGTDGAGGAWLAARGRGGGLALWRRAAAGGTKPALQDQETTP
jgi:hypothetical protein